MKKIKDRSIMIFLRFIFILSTVFFTSLYYIDSSKMILVVAGLISATTAILTVVFMESILRIIKFKLILSGILGLFFGLFLGHLLVLALSTVEIQIIQKNLFFIKPVLYHIFGFFLLIFFVKNSDKFSFLNSLDAEDQKSQNCSVLYKILDTSVIIDGRISDICETGFIDGILIIPNFVLNELQMIADSADSIKRNRGRRGLDILNKIQKDQDVTVKISDIDFKDIHEVDAKLVQLAKVMKAKIITNDFNLNKVAEFHGVEVLNINQLSNALKSIVLPAEEMKIALIKTGKDAAQAIGYLDDGTMVVVENGREKLNSEVKVIVTSVLQTSAGRMIFARLKEGF